MSNKFDIALSFASEDQALVEKVYDYLRAEDIKPFFAPSPEGQVFLSGKNQRETFYRIFGKDARYVALFVSKNYIVREVPMEEAGIALGKHRDDGSVIPIYIDGTQLPDTMLDPKRMNYFESDNPVTIADHLAKKIKADKRRKKQTNASGAGNNVMTVSGNTCENGIFIQNYNRR